MANEITNQDIMDMLTGLVERTNEIGNIKKDLTAFRSETNQHFREIDVKLETKIEPTLQLILENQGTVTKHTEDIANLKQRQSELEDKVDGLGYAVQELQKKMA